MSAGQVEGLFAPLERAIGQLARQRDDAERRVVELLVEQQRFNDLLQLLAIGGTLDHSERGGVVARDSTGREIGRGDTSREAIDAIPDSELEG